MINRKNFQTLEFEDILQNDFKTEGLDFNRFYQEEDFFLIKRSLLERMAYRVRNKICSISPFKLQTPSIQHEDCGAKDNRTYKV